MEQDPATTLDGCSRNGLEVRPECGLEPLHVVVIEDVDQGPELLEPIEEGQTIIL